MKIKHFLFLFVALGMFILCCDVENLSGEEQDVNLLKDPSFESGYDGEGSWRMIEGVERVNDLKNAYDGMFFCKIKEKWRGPYQDNLNGVAVKGVLKYIFSCYAKKFSGEREDLILHVQFINDEKNPGPVEQKWFILTSDISNSYERYSVLFETPQNAAYILLKIYSNVDNPVIALDACQLEQSQVPTEYKKVKISRPEVKIISPEPKIYGKAESEKMVLVINNPSNFRTNCEVEVRLNKVGLNGYIKVEDVLSGNEIPFQIEDDNLDGKLDDSDVLVFNADIEGLGYGYFSMVKVYKEISYKDAMEIDISNPDFISVKSGNFKVKLNPCSILPETLEKNGFILEPKINISPQGNITGNVLIQKGPVRMRVDTIRGTNLGEVQTTFFIYPYGRIDYLTKTKTEQNPEIWKVPGIEVKIKRELFNQRIISRFDEIKTFALPKEMNKEGFQKGVMPKGTWYPHDASMAGFLNIEKNLGFSLAVRGHPTSFAWGTYFVITDNLYNGEDTLTLNNNIGMGGGKRLILSHRVPMLMFDSNETDEFVRRAEIIVRIYNENEFNELLLNIKRILLECKKNLTVLNPQITLDNEEIDKATAFYKANLLIGLFGKIESMMKDESEKLEGRLKVVKQKGLEFHGAQIASGKSKVILNVAHLDKTIGRRPLEKYILYRLKGNLLPIEISEKRPFERIGEACRYLALANRLIDKVNKEKLPSLLDGKDEEAVIGVAESRLYRIPSNYHTERHHEILKMLGMKNIHFHMPQWEADESSPGQYDFGWIDEYRKWWKKYDIKTWFQIHGAIVNESEKEGYIRWVDKKYPDWRNLDSKGEPIEIGFGMTMAPIDPQIYGEVPEWMELFKRYNQKMVERYEDVSFAWTGWNEPGMYNPDTGYDKYNRIAFRKWLESKYKDLESLNRIWESNYHTWDEVEPPRHEENLLVNQEGNFVSLAGNWRFNADAENAGLAKGWNKADYNDSKWDITRVPSYWEEDLLSYKDYDGFAWYRRYFTIPGEWKDKKVTVQFDSIDDDAWVYINGNPVIVHHGYNTPFKTEISRYLKFDKNNLLAIRVFDDHGLGGIYKDVKVIPQEFRLIEEVYANPCKEFDWRLFKIENFAGFLGFQSDIIHDFDPEKPIAAKMWYQNDEAGLRQCKDPFYWARRVNHGLYGVDEYSHNYNSIRALDMFTGASDDLSVWYGEYGDTTKTGYDNYPMTTILPDDVRLYTWNYITHGARGFFFWRFDEPGCLLEPYLNVNDSLLEVAKLNQEVLPLSKLFSGRRDVKCVIYFPRNSMLLCKGGYSTDKFNSLHRLFYDLQIPVQFIDSGQILNGKLNKYKILAIAGSPYFTDGEAEVIKKFIESGGSVIAYSDFAVYNDYCKQEEITPGLGLNVVFGASTEDKSTDHPNLLLKTEWNAPVQIDAQYLLYRIHPVNARVIMKGIENQSEYSLCSMVQRNKGKAFLIGFNIAKLYEDNRENPMGKYVSDIFMTLLKEAGYKQQVTGSGARFTIMKNGIINYLICINQSQNESFVKAEIDIENIGQFSLSKNRIYEILTLEEIPFSIEDSKVKFKLHLLPKEVKVFSLK